MLTPSPITKLFVRINAMPIDSKLKTLIEYTFYFLLFTVPLIFLPGHVELFQFNKMILVYLSTVVITSAWVLRMIIRGKIFIRRTPFDIPLLLFLYSQILSTIFSIDPYTSLWGYYSRFHGGLFSTISYLLLFYSFVSNFSQSEEPDSENNESLFVNPYLKKATSVLLASVSIVALYGILEHFGIDENYWVQDVRHRVFSTIGQPNWLAALLVTTIPLPLLYITHFLPQENLKKLESRIRVVSLSVFSIFYLTLLYTKSRSGFLGFLVMFASFWSLQVIGKFKQAKKKEITLTKSLSALKKPFFISSSLVLVFSLLAGTPFTPQITKLPQKLENPPPSTPSSQTATGAVDNGVVKPAVGGTPSEDIRMIVWRGAIDVWKNWPILGSGVETFAYSYYNFRPLEHNFVSEWDFLYNKAHNEYLNFLATTGLFGLSSYLLLQFWFAIWSLKKTLTNQLQPIAFISGYLGLSLVNFFGFSTVSVGMLFFLYPAFSLLATSEKPKWLLIKFSKKEPEKLNYLQIFLTIITLMLTLNALIEIASRWYADRIFEEGKNLARSEQIPQGLILQQKASALVPEEPLFHDSLALEMARSASALYYEGATESALFLAKGAQEHSDFVYQKNPYHINYLKNRTAAMLHLSTIDPSYKQKAFETLLHAIEKSPTDPKLTFNLGLFYYDQGEFEKSIFSYQKTLELKPDYLAARLELASTLMEQGQTESARQQYEYILKYLDPSHPTALQALELIATPSAQK